MLVMPFWVRAVPWPFAHWPLAPAKSTVHGNRAARAADSPVPVNVPLRPPAPSLPSPVEREAGSEGVAAPSLLSLVTWQAWLFLAWAAVILCRVLYIVRQRYGLHRLMRLTTPAGDDLAGRVRELSQQLGLRREPRVLLVDHTGLLFVCGLLVPKLVMPQTLPGTLSAADMDQVILHELAHLRRGDLYWGWTIELARTAYFFHPLVYWVGYCVNLERSWLATRWRCPSVGTPPATTPKRLSASPPTPPGQR